MTNDKEELIEVEMSPPSVFENLHQMEMHWGEPSPDWAGEEMSQEEEDIMYGEDMADALICGLLTVHIDALEPDAKGAESKFRNNNSTLIERLASQGIETLILLNIKSGGDIGVRLEYVEFN